MKLLKIPFKAIGSGYEEKVYKHLSHSELVEFLAVGKAKSAALKFPNAIIISADTMISFGSKIIGKPRDKKDAEKMLRSFGTKAQIILTGVCVMDVKTGKLFSFVSKSKIYFKKLSNQEIIDYIQTGEPFDKAGGYGPLGPGLNLISKISGDSTTVYGLPLALVINALQKLGVKF